MGEVLHASSGIVIVKVYVPVAVLVAVRHWFPVELFWTMT